MAGRPNMSVAWVSSRFTVSSPGAGGAVASVIDRGADVGRAHAPNRPMISRRASATVTAPTTAITVVSGRMTSCWNFTTSSRVRRPTDSCVPSTGTP